MKLDYIIPKVDPALIRAELTEDTFVRQTKKAGNEIYIINHENAPNTLKEIGRLREISFAQGGGGTGKPMDIDKYDTNETAYDQLVVYSPEDQEIVGGYRFIDCMRIKDAKKEAPLSVNDYFELSETFVEHYLPFTIELGRSWIQPEFQSSNPRKGLFTLDNLWEGLGALAVLHPHIKYFFGKVTTYPSYNTEAHEALLQFMHYYFPDKDKLVKPIIAFESGIDVSDFITSLKGKDYKTGHKLLHNYVHERGERIPPLINSYMNLSPSMKTFGTMVNKDFGNVMETGIMITIPDIFPEKIERYIGSFDKE